MPGGFNGGTMADVAHTRAEMDQAIAKMEQVTRSFYGPATRTGCHAFIEFCGFMNEYIQVCRVTMESGDDFLLANTHAEQPLVMKTHHARYLAEKFDCIFGPSLRADPKVAEIFLRAILGEELIVVPRGSTS